ncbi:MAG TPA: hypothetical protein VGM99_07900, partial [Candidatus Cybelea sp.]
MKADSLPSFTTMESNLGMGASLGNSAVWILTKGTGQIERVFLNDAAQSLIGTIGVQYGSRSKPLGSLGFSDAGEPSDGHDSPSYTQLFADVGKRAFELHPAYQRVRYTLKSVIDIVETTFLPLGSAKPGHEDPPLVYIIVDVINRDTIAHHARVIGSAMLSGSTPADVQTRFEASAQALVSVNKSHPDWVRIFGLSEPPTRYGCDFDYGGTYDATYLHNVRNNLDAVGAVLGRLQLDLALEPNGHRQFCCVAGVYA